MDNIELFSKNKIAYLRSKGVRELYKSVHNNDDRKVFISYIYPASAEVENLLLQYKNDEELHNYLREFKIVNSEMFCAVMGYLDSKNDKQQYLN